MLLLDILFFLLAVTLTFDRVLNFEFLGFTIRLAHFLSIFFFGTVVYTRWKKGLPLVNYKTPLTLPLLLYLSVAFLSLIKTQFIIKSVGYLTWATFDFLIIFLGVVNYVDINPQRISKVIRIHLLSYVLVCILGLTQIFSPALGFHPRIVQWLPNGIPRMNAFFYEPSYFAFFVIQGVVILGIILLFGQRLYPKVANFPIFALMTTACFLSSSRSGWLALAGFFLLAGYLAVKKGVIRRFIKASLGVIIVIICVTFVLNKLYCPKLKSGNYSRTNVPGYSKESLPETISTLAKMGMDPQERSSSRPRLLGMWQGLKMFSANPWLGVGIGGYGGYITNNPELAMNVYQETDPYGTTTTNLWVEVLAETGILGFLCLVFILWTFIKTSWKTIHSHNSPSTSCYIMGYLAAIFVIFAISYQFNQTLFRTDVWLLMGTGIGMAKSLTDSNKLPTS